MGLIVIKKYKKVKTYYEKDKLVKCFCDRCGKEVKVGKDWEDLGSGGVYYSEKYKILK